MSGRGLGAQLIRNCLGKNIMIQRRELCSPPDRRGEFKERKAEGKTQPFLGGEERHLTCEKEGQVESILPWQ